MDMTQQIIADFRKRCESADFAENLGQFLDQAADIHGDKRAWHYIEDASEISFAELAAGTRALAESFLAAGIGKGTKVSVMLPNIPEFPLSWLALARIGAVMVPVNIHYTAREVAYVMTDSEATFLIVQTGQFRELRETEEAGPILSNVGRILVGERVEGCLDWKEMAGKPVEGIAFPSVRLDDLLNIQYTSGTTGFPKGCMLTQRYWSILSAVTAERLSRRPHNVLAAQPFYYMDPQWLLLMSLRIGGTLFVAPKASSSRFMGWVRTYGIEFCIFPDVVMKLPVQPDDADNSLKAAAMFGLAPGLHDALQQRFGLVAREGYGMTEIGSALITPLEVRDMVGTGTCGVASPFRETSIRDLDGNPVGDGEVGELWVRGPGLMLGYWNKPDANAEVFREGGWFRTGDLFRRDARGFHYIVGRLKDMIRRSNENIAAREVEAVLMTYPDIREVAVIPVPDQDRGQEVKACIVLKEDVTRDAFRLDDFFAHCAAQLAPFKIPRFIEIRHDLPKTPSDKVAKHVLVSEKPDLRVGAFDRSNGSWL